MSLTGEKSEILVDGNVRDAPPLTHKGSVAPREAPPGDGRPVRLCALRVHGRVRSPKWTAAARRVLCFRRANGDAQRTRVVRSTKATRYASRSARARLPLDSTTLRQEGFT